MEDRPILVLQRATAEDLLTEWLPDAKVIRIDGVDITIRSAASGKAIFDAAAELRRQTGIKYELFMERMQDQNKLRIKLMEKRK